MNIALIGATGRAGSRVLAELLARGHRVTAVVRHPNKVPVDDAVAAVATDGSAGSIATAIAGHDAVVSSVRFVDLDPEILLAAVRRSGVRRYLVVGGAGSLIHEDGTEEANRPEFPAAGRANSQRGSDFLNLLRLSEDLDWTFISPSRRFTAGERTGTFRYGTDFMLLDKVGQPTWISYEDLAVALADELETPRHVRQRFTIGY